LYNAELSGADLSYVTARNANLGGTSLNRAYLRKADLTGVDFSHSDMQEADFASATLMDANFEGAIIGWTTFADVDLRNVRGLDSLRHRGPSTVGIDTLFRTSHAISETFLRGAGVPEDFITFVPSLVGRPIEFYSCFISYSHQDEEFSRRLHSRMQAERL